MKHLAALLVLVVAAGCQYAPAGYEENLPTLEDGTVDFERVVYGNVDIEYLNRSSGNVLCSVDASVVGWRGQDILDSDCPDCSEVFTLYQRIDYDDTSCPSNQDEDDAPVTDIPQTVVIGITEVANIEEENPNLWEWAVDNEALAIARVSWRPFSDANWTSHFGLFEQDEPTDDEDIVREYRAANRYRWILPRDQSFAVSWSMDLEFSE